jgi:hypothetical protein
VPFTGATPMDVMVAHVGSPPPSPRSYEPALPIALEVLVLRMLAKAPEARPQSVDEVRAELEEAVVQLGAPRPRGSREMPALIPMKSQPHLPPMFGQLPELLAPLPEASAPAAPTPVPEPDPEPRSRTGLFVGVVVLGLFGSAAAWVLTRPATPAQPTPEDVARLAVVDPPVPVIIAAEDAGADAGEEDAGLDDAGVEDAGVDAGVVDAGVPEEPIDAKTLKRAPTVKQLKDRAAKLEVRAKKKKVERAALLELKKLRVEAAAANTPLKRVRADRALAEWERTWLPKR